jgi:hypothetical protein
MLLISLPVTGTRYGPENLFGNAFIRYCNYSILFPSIKDIFSTANRKIKIVYSI